MKTKQILAIIILFVALQSCKKTDTTPQINPHADAWGDVILKKMNMNGNIKYQLIFFADGEGIAASGNTVTGPDGSVYDLHDIPWMPGNKQTGAGNPSGTKPPAGVYTFRLKFQDGSTAETKDTLETTELDVPAITNLTYDQNTQTIHVEWTPVPNPDLYCVKITELDMANTKPFFKKGKLPVNANALDIRIDGGNGWLRPTSELQSGTDYYVVVAAKKVEQGKPVEGNSKNFQTSSCTKRTFTY